MVLGTFTGVSRGFRFFFIFSERLGVQRYFRRMVSEELQEVFRALQGFQRRWSGF